MVEQLGVAPHVVAWILNHELGKAQGVGGATGVYIRRRDERAMREALAQWSMWVALLVTGDPKVTP
jgi:hypothetical protein